MARDSLLALFFDRTHQGGLFFPQVFEFSIFPSLCIKELSLTKTRRTGKSFRTAGGRKRKETKDRRPVFDRARGRKEPEKNEKGRLRGLGFPTFFRSMELNDAFRGILEDPTDMAAWREVRHRYRLIARQIAEGPQYTEEEIEARWRAYSYRSARAGSSSSSDESGSEEEELDTDEDEEDEQCRLDADWRTQMIKRATKEGHLLKSKLLDPLVLMTVDGIENWNARFTGIRIEKSGRSRARPTKGAKDGLRAMILRAFETLENEPALGLREALRRAFEVLIAWPTLFRGPTKGRLRSIDKELGTSWGRIWVRLSQADLIKNADWTGASGPVPPRRLRWDEPKVRDGVWVYQFRSVADAINRRLEERIREATATLEGFESEPFSEEPGSSSEEDSAPPSPRTDSEPEEVAGEPENVVDEEQPPAKKTRKNKPALRKKKSSKATKRSPTSSEEEEEAPFETKPKTKNPKKPSKATTSSTFEEEEEPTVESKTKKSKTPRVTARKSPKKRDLSTASVRELLEDSD